MSVKFLLSLSWVYRFDWLLLVSTGKKLFLWIILQQSFYPISSFLNLHYLTQRECESNFSRLFYPYIWAYNVIFSPFNKLKIYRRNTRQTQSTIKTLSKADGDQKVSLFEIYWSETLNSIRLNVNYIRTVRWKKVCLLNYACRFWVRTASKICEKIVKETNNGVIS